LLVWQVLVLVLDLPGFILPSPAEVGGKFLDVLASGLLWRHFSATLVEILLGLVFGISAATLLGYALAKSPLAERLLSPFLVGSQSIPMAAIAPLLVIWFGPGLISKVLICSLTVFFPVLVNTLVGLRDVSPELREVMRSLRATPAQTLRYIVIPQLARIVLPPLTGQFASLVKDSSILSFIAVNELTKNVLEVDALTFTTFENLAILAVLYLSITLPISLLTRHLERKMSYAT